MNYAWMQTPIGRVLLSLDETGLGRIDFANGNSRPGPAWHESPDALKETIRQLRAYFARELEEFEVRLAPEGTPFQKNVWRHLCEIPYGETISYGELAHRVGNPRASRAVGLANGANPIPIIIPCHLVIGSNGRRTGYGCGHPIKAKLLALVGQGRARELLCHAPRGRRTSANS